MKVHRNSVNEAARLLDVQRSAVETWIEQGLPIVIKQHPLLITDAARKLRVQRA